MATQRNYASTRSYEDAIRIINSRQRSRRPVAPADASNTRTQPAGASGTVGLRGAPAIAGMREWLHSLGHSIDDINSLNIIHVAGTKGKGSTCAFIESFLRSHGQRSGYPLKTGLYTSPHLLLPEERIRIGSKPLSQESLAKYFFEVYDRLPQLSQDYDPTLETVARGPRFLQLFALLAFHVFIREMVDVVILETHCGGEYDATNIVEPVVAVVTTLGMDHVDMLGPSLENIAWHKGGIFKKGAVALSAIQELRAAEVLIKRSAEKNQELRFIDTDPRLPMSVSVLKPEVQRKNASLAAAAAQAFLHCGVSKAPSTLTEDVLAEGIKQLSWPGRFQVIQEEGWSWYLDAAHNEMSVNVAAQWFAQCQRDLPACRQNMPRILIFSHINELRNAAALLGNLGTALTANGAQIDHVIFSTYDESDLVKGSDLDYDPELFRTTWTRIDSATELWHEPTIQGAMSLARELGRDGMQTLITGSQHLVGPALRILNWSEVSGKT